MATISEILTSAMAEFEQFGYDSEERLARWVAKLSAAAGNISIVTPEKLRETLSAVYAREVLKGGLVNRHKLPTWKVNMLAPKLRNELDRKLMASAQLIKLNREEMIARTIRRFSGWATSIPMGGSDAIDKPEVKENIKKALKSLPFEERRVMIDQAAKLKASLDNIVAVDGGALAGMWKSHYRAAGYNARPDHTERDGDIFVIRDNWALQKGLMKLGGAQYTDEIEAPAEFVYCQCRYKYIYNLRDLPDSMLTAEGLAAVGRK